MIFRWLKVINFYEINVKCLIILHLVYWCKNLINNKLLYLNQNDYFLDNITCDFFFEIRTVPEAGEA